MKIKRTGLLLCSVFLLAALVGCSRKTTAQKDSPRPDAVAAQPESSYSEAADSLEEAASTSTIEDVAPPLSGLGEAEASLPGEQSAQDDTPAGELPIGEAHVDTETSRTEDETDSRPERALPVLGSSVTSPSGSGGALTSKAAAAQTALDLDEIEREFLNLINEERSNNGLTALGIEESMQFAARIRAQEALISLSHTRPDDTPYYTAFDEAGFAYTGKWHGENLAVVHVSASSVDNTLVAKELFREWVDSPGHYLNVLMDGFVQTGLGVHIQQDGDSLAIGCAQLFSSL